MVAAKKHVPIVKKRGHKKFNRYEYLEIRTGATIETRQEDRKS
jgi:hypothetical protein